jgi:hypothetical protein
LRADFKLSLILICEIVFEITVDTLVGELEEMCGINSVRWDLHPSCGFEVVHERLVFCCYGAMRSFLVKF